MRTSLSSRDIPREEVGQFDPTQGNETAVAKFMMKKRESKEQLVYTIETYEDGRKYEGFTLNGKKQGSGKLTYEDGAYYEGEFKDDRMNGKGTLYYCEGKPAYDGQWLDDQFHGYGILYNENPVPLAHGFDCQDFNEVEDYWLRYEGTSALTQASSCSTTSPAGAGCCSATASGSRASSRRISCTGRPSSGRPTDSSWSAGGR